VIGRAAGYSINHASSDYNVIIGSAAGTGGAAEFSANIAIGFAALNSTGTNAVSGQIAIGYNALTSLTSGDGNTVIGTEAAEDITTGNYNTVIGQQAIQNAQTDVSNTTALGWRAGYKLGDDGGSDHSESNIMIGVSALGGGSGTIASNTANFNIAIGNSTLGAGTSTASSMAGNTVIGHNASNVATNGADNVVIGKDAALTMTTGYFNTIIGKGANPSAVGGANQIVIGRAATGTGDNETVIGNSSQTKVSFGGDALISGSAQSTGSFGRIETVGDVAAGGDVIAFDSSDERLKDNIEIIKNPIEKVEQLRGVEFQWNGLQNSYASGSYDSGIIAQDVQKVLPQIVKEKNSGYLGVRQERLVGLLIEAIKDQQKQIDDLECQIEEIRNGSS